MHGNPAIRVTRALALAAALVVLFPLAAAEPPLEEERVHPGEVTFEQGAPWYQDGPNRVPLQTRVEAGQTVYYRLVRYDPEHGYLRDDTGFAGVDAGSRGARPSASGPGIYYGNGLYGPDPFRSPYNRDARQRYVGPGYIGACDWRGCREMHLYPSYYGGWR